jgi:hypothetical protein
MPSQSRVTTLPAPTRVSPPMVTPGELIAPPLVHMLRPMRTGRRSTARLSAAPGPADGRPTKVAYGSGAAVVARLMVRPVRRGRCRIRSDNWNSDPHPPISAGARGLILCPAERQPKLRRFFAYLADGAAEECRRLRHGVTGFDALAQVNDIHLGPFPAGVGSFHPPGSLVALGPLKPQCNVYASAVRYLPLAWHYQRTILGFG